MSKARQGAEQPNEESDEAVLRLDRQLCFAAYSLSQAFTRTYKEHLDALGLTYPQYLVLLVLWEEDDRTLKQIGDLLHLDSGTLTPLLKRMQAAGLVVRARDPRDERHVRVTLTERARDLKGKVAAVRRAVGCATGRSPAEIQSLRDEMVAIRQALT